MILIWMIWGGGEKYMMSIAECLSSENEVTVFWNNKQDVDKLLERFTLNLSRVTLSENIFSPKFNFFKRLIATRNYDVIIFLSDGSVPFSFSKKLFLHIQQPISGLKNSFKTRIKLSRVDKIFCNSLYSKSFVDRYLKVDSSVLYPPVDIKVKKMKKENVILHVGRFRVKNVSNSDFKKQGVMVEAFKEMVDAGFGDWTLILAVGVQDRDTESFELMKKNAEGYPIKFMVNKSNDELWSLYSKAKIYWHASGFGEDLNSHPEYAEHFGISTVEAMGAGLVPIVINAGGQKEIVVENISGFLWNNLDELKYFTLKLTKDKDLLEKLSKGAMLRAQKFAGERFCKDLAKIIK